MTTPSTTTLTCVDGQNFDLLNPQVKDVSFKVICEHLAKINRYNGGTPGTVYSVAQHSSLCAKVALMLTGDSTLAAYLLCHDMHEAYLGDDTTPKKRALAAIIGGFGVLASAVNDAFGMLTDRIDIAIHARAGLAWPPTSEQKTAIHTIDRMLLSTEWRDLMPFPKPYDFGAEPYSDTVVPNPRWQDSALEMHALCATLLPGFKVREAV